MSARKQQNFSIHYVDLVFVLRWQRRQYYCCGCCSCCYCCFCCRKGGDKTDRQIKCKTPMQMISWHAIAARIPSSTLYKCACASLKKTKCAVSTFSLNKKQPGTDTTNTQRLTHRSPSRLLMRQAKIAQ